MNQKFNFIHSGLDLSALDHEAIAIRLKQHAAKLRSYRSTANVQNGVYVLNSCERRAPELVRYGLEGIVSSHLGRKEFQSLKSAHTNVEVVLALPATRADEIASEFHCKFPLPAKF